MTTTLTSSSWPQQLQTTAWKLRWLLIDSTRRPKIAVPNNFLGLVQLSFDILEPTGKYFCVKRVLNAPQPPLFHFQSKTRMKFDISSSNIQKLLLWAILLFSSYRNCSQPCAKAAKLPPPIPPSHREETPWKLTTSVFGVGRLHLQRPVHLKKKTTHIGLQFH